MVNSPSRPNVRPVDPPPLGESVRHTLTMSPTGIQPARGGDDPVPTVLDVGGGGRPLTIKAESRQKTL